MSAAHSHDKSDPGKGEAGLDWLRVADVAFWAAVTVLAALAVEWLLGKVVRESLSAGASRYLKKVTAASPDQSQSS